MKRNFAVNVEPFQIRERMKKAILDSGYTIAGFGYCTGTSRTSICREGKKHYYPSLPTLILIAKKCNVSLDWLVFGEEVKDGCEQHS